MLSNMQKMVILKAVKLRMKRGENKEDILNSYKNLTEKDKADIMDSLE